jgi:hypothetical protein
MSFFSALVVTAEIALESRFPKVEFLKGEDDRLSPDNGQTVSNPVCPQSRIIGKFSLYRVVVSKNPVFRAPHRIVQRGNVVQLGHCRARQRSAPVQTIPYGHRFCARLAESHKYEL